MAFIWVITVVVGITVAAVAKNNVTKGKKSIKKAATVFVAIIGLWLLGLSGTQLQAQAQRSDTAAQKALQTSQPKVLPGVQPPAAGRLDTTIKGRQPATAGRSDTDSTSPAPDSTLKRALRPFSLKLPGSKEHTPKGATIRSLIIPGWGQAYNHEYWKVPLAVAAVAIPIYLYLDNSKEYNAARQAYSVVFEEMPVISGGKGKLDPAKFAQLEQKFQDAYNSYKKVGGNYVTNYLSTIQSYRNTFRQYRDYSIVAALLGWGLQIADATVFGHLHGFDVSDDISIRVRPVYFQYARIPGIGLSFSLK